MASDVERIKEKLPIEEVVGAYVKLEKGGGRLKGRCPFHTEKSPSFFVSPERGTYYCFGCGAKGDIFTFVQEFERLDFIGALKSLAQRAGIELSSSRTEERISKSHKEALYEILERSTLYYQKQLALRKDVQAYLTSRGLSVTAIKSWRLGFAPDEWTPLSDALKQKGYSPELMAKAGLTKVSEKNPKESYDRFRSRIMFPLFDIGGRVVGFSGRIFGDDANAAKYLNSPETELFDKSSFLYGFDRAKLEIRKQDKTILVEGQMDLLMSHEAGITNTVAVSGTALTDKHIDLLRRFSRTLVLAFDGDLAGVRASARAYELALAKDMEVRVVPIAAGQDGEKKDPADLIKEDPQLWKKALESQVHIIEYELDQVMKESDVRKRERRLEGEVLPYIAALSSPLERSRFIQTVSLRSGLNERVLESAISKIEVVEKNSLPETKDRFDGIIQQGNRGDIIERKLAALCVWYELKKDVSGLEALREKIKHVSEDLLKRLSDHIAHNQEELTFEAEASFKDANLLEKEIVELLANAEEEHLKSELSLAVTALKRFEAAGDGAGVTQALKHCQELSLKLHSLKKQL